MRVSEKALELNVSENLVREIRAWGKPYGNAYVYGFSLRYEARTGLDISINVPYNCSFLFGLQFKKPKRKSDSWYIFAINNNRRHDQHLMLLLSCMVFGTDNIYYAFPLIAYVQELSRCSPNFLRRTVFAKIDKFPSFTFDFNEHIVRIDENNPRVA
mgnify:CR=1 FL=1